MREVQDGSMMTSFQEPNGDYGFDNPSGIFVLGGVVLVFWAFALVQALLGHWLPAVIGGFLGLFPLATLVSYIYSTRRGKLRSGRNCWTLFNCGATNKFSTWAAVVARC